ncbi:MAG: STAS domain-containing protein [cyanobacterium endosymbiont of Rhopalodia sterrenbergii]
MILNFTQTQSIDSSGVRALVHNFKVAQNYNFEMVLYHLHPSIMLVFSMIELDEVFPNYQNPG